MKLPKRKYYGVFIRRDSRFSATVKIGHRLEYVFVPNSGRMKELLKLGNEVLLTKSNTPNRKTKLDLILVKLNNRWISVDSRVPNKFFKELFKKKLLKPFLGFKSIKPEVKFGRSRFDFLLSSPPIPSLIKEGGRGAVGEVKPYFLEVKSVTLVNGDTAMFPDAPTERGTRHLKELIKAKEQGNGAGILFLVQRQDARNFRPNDSHDPAFGRAIRKAVKKGIDVFSYTCKVKENEITLKRAIPICLDKKSGQGK